MGVRRSEVARLMVAAALSIAGCSTTGTVDGPVLTPPPTLFAGGFDGNVFGTLAFADGSGCLYLVREGHEYPVVWPSRAVWQPDPPSVRLGPSVGLGAQVVEVGMTVSGSGGWFSREGIEELAGREVADAAARCAGPTGEIALFNIRSEVTVTSG